MREHLTETQDKAVTAARKYLSGGGLLNPHGFRHSMRVWRNAQMLNRLLDLKVDDDRLCAACMFHDFARGKVSGEKHGAKCAEKLRESNILNEIGLSDKVAREEVFDAIGKHDVTTSKDERETLAKLLYDADKMDAFGWIGVFRHFQHFIYREHRRPSVALKAAENRFNNLSYEETKRLVSNKYKLTRSFFRVLSGMFG